MATEKSAKTDAQKREELARSIEWDDSKMASSYANVCNVASTREEMTLLFGTNQAWHSGQEKLKIMLTNRIVLNPYAAKRLHALLGAAIEKYESTFGAIVIGSADPAEAATKG